MGWSAWEVALAAQIMASSGIVIDRNAVDPCRVCGISVKRRNWARHVSSWRHHRSFKRAWNSGPLRGAPFDLPVR